MCKRDLLNGLTYRTPERWRTQWLLGLKNWMPQGSESRDKGLGGPRKLMVPSPRSLMFTEGLTVTDRPTKEQERIHYTCFALDPI